MIQKKKKANTGVRITNPEIHDKLRIIARKNRRTIQSQIEILIEDAYKLMVE
jgi:hypothetical protein